MIPKVAYFHWTGPPMGWLRMTAIETFKRLNPSWEVVLLDTLPSIKPLGIGYGQEADWTWWETLLEKGGFQVATDIIFTKPVPEEWLNCEINACVDDENLVRQFAMLGCVAGNEWMRVVVDGCRELAQKGGQHDYQAFGVGMLRGFRVPDNVLFRQSMDALCQFRCWQPPSLWEPHGLDLLDDAIGVHWYGGHEASKKHEPEAGPGHPGYIVTLAESVLREVAA